MATSFAIIEPTDKAFFCTGTLERLP
jgi:hypothetical protein